MGYWIRSQLIALCLLVGLVPAADSQSSKPELVLTSEGHTGDIRDLAVAPDGRSYVTVSIDGTARVWRSDTNLLRRVIRPPSLQNTATPQRNSRPGQLLAAAISPNNEMLAVGGDIRFNGGHVFVYDLNTGDLLTTLRYQPGQTAGRVKALTFVETDQGLKLVAGLGRSKGIAVWDIAPGRLDQTTPANRWDICDFAVEDTEAGPRNTLLLSCSSLNNRHVADQGRVIWLNLLTGERSDFDLGAGFAGAPVPWDVSYNQQNGLVAVGLRQSLQIPVLALGDAGPGSGQALRRHTLQPGNALARNTIGDAERTADYSRLAWSADGKFLYATGRLGLTAEYTLIQRWATDQLGGSGELAASGALQTISAIEPLPDGRMLWASYDATFGQLSSDFRQTFAFDVPIQDFRIGSFPSSVTNENDNSVIGQPGSGRAGNNADEFYVSYDGSQVLVRSRQQGGGILFVDILNRRVEVFERNGLSTIRAKAEELFEAPPEDHSTPRRRGKAYLPTARLADVSLTDWNETPVPQISGNEVALVPGSLSRSATLFEPESESVAAAVSTGFDLRIVSSDGDIVESTTLPAVGWRTNVSGNGRFVIGALGDGTLRWYSAGSADLKLSILPLTDGRWIVWTPAGYFDASIGAADLVGWRTDDGKTYPAKLFQDELFKRYPIEDVFAEFKEVRTYYSEVIRASSTGGDAGEVPTTEDPVIDEIEAPGDTPQPPPPAPLTLTRVRTISSVTDLPPTVEILSSELTEDGKVKITYRVDSPDGSAAGNLRIYADGYQVELGENAKTVDFVGATSSITLENIPAGTRTIGMAVENENGFSLRALNEDLADVIWPERNQPALKKRLLAVVVGAQDYQSFPPLTYTGKDATDIAALLRAQEGLEGGYDDVQIRLLNDPSDDTRTPVYENIKAAIEWLRLSCAGEAIERVSVFDAHACPEDSDHESYQTTRLFYFSGHGETADDRYYMLPIDTESNGANAIPASDLHDFVEQANGRKIIMLDTCDAADFAVSRAVSELSESADPVYLYMSSSSGTPSRENREIQNSVFTQAFIEAFTNTYDGPISRLDEYDLPARKERPREVLQHVELESFLVLRVVDLSSKLGLGLIQEPIIQPVPENRTNLFAVAPDFPLDNQPD